MFEHCGKNCLVCTELLKKQRYLASVSKYFLIPSFLPTGCKRIDIY